MLIKQRTKALQPQYDDGSPSRSGVALYSTNSILSLFVPLGRYRFPFFSSGRLQLILLLPACVPPPAGTSHSRNVALRGLLSSPKVCPQSRDPLSHYCPKVAKHSPVGTSVVGDLLPLTVVPLGVYAACLAALPVCMRRSPSLVHLKYFSPLSLRLFFPSDRVCRR